MSGTLQDDRPNYILVGLDALALLPTIGASAFAVYSVIVSHSHNKTLACWPSRATIARESGLSARTVDGAVAALKGAGLLSITRRKDSTGKVNMSNVYTLTSAPRGGRNSAPGVGGILRRGGRNSAPELDLDELDLIELETSSPPAAEQVTADTNGTSKGQPKTRKPRDPGPWAAFRDQALTDYGQPSTGPTQALVTRIVKTAEHHGLDPAKAARLWAEWRAETKANGTAKFAPLHLASQAWGEWIAATRTNTATLDIPRSVSIRGVRL